MLVYGNSNRNPHGYHILCVDAQSHREEARRARQVGLLGLDGDRLRVGC